MNLLVRPGGNDVVKDASDIFGASRVVAGIYKEPTQLNNLETDEVIFAKELFESQGRKVIEI